MALWTFVLLDPVSVFLLLALIFLTTFWFLSSNHGKSPLPLPPGPRPLPVIGNLHLIDIRRQDLSYMKLSEKYGPVFTVYLGFQKFLVLTGYEAVKEALTSKGNEFINRPPLPIFRQMQSGHGVIFSDGELWKATRRYTLASLRDLGMGKKRIEGKIQEELQFLVELIKSFKGEAFPLKTLTLATTNVAYGIVFGDRFDYDDETFLTLLKHVDDVVVLLGEPQLQVYNVYPFLGFLLKPHKMILDTMEKTRVILREYLAAGKKRINENLLQNYYDYMLTKQQSEERSKDRNLFHDANIVAAVFDLVLAGTETTGTTLQWAILLMMKYPDIQRQAREEIERVIGLERLPTCEDRKQLPFNNAIVHEVQRFASILQQFPRCTAVDTCFRGYFIPKGTPVIPSLTSVLYDKTQWETPTQFNPNHFLDAEGNFVKKDAFLPFTIGVQGIPPTQVWIQHRARCASVSLASSISPSHTHSQLSHTQHLPCLGLVVLHPWMRVPSSQVMWGKLHSFVSMTTSCEWTCEWWHLTGRLRPLHQCFPTFFGQRHTCVMKKISRHTTMPDGERSLFTYVKKNKKNSNSIEGNGR
ncbi:cytochrome P450 2W1-like isoform X2 [Podarcis muralis]